MMGGGLETDPDLNKRLDLINAGIEYNTRDSNEDIKNFGSRIEKQRLELIVGIINKRKKIRDVVINRLDELIVYCDNKIMEVENVYVYTKRENDQQLHVERWQQKILELENQKINEHKEMFKDILFLRNEWIKSILNYTEEKMIDSLLDKINTNKGFATEKINEG